MEKKFFRASFGARQLVTLAPALIMALVLGVLWIFKDKGQFTSASGILGLMVIFWLGMGLWRVLTEGYMLGEKALVIVNGPQRVTVSYDSILRVMAGDVTLPGSRMAKGALLIEQEGAARGQLLYPRDIPALVAELKARAPEAIFITTAEEYEEVKANAAQNKK